MTINKLRKNSYLQQYQVHQFLCQFYDNGDDCYEIEDLLYLMNAFVKLLE